MKTKKACSVQHGSHTKSLASGFSTVPFQEQEKEGEADMRLFHREKTQERDY